jgi:hypothetical protein
VKSAVGMTARMVNPNQCVEFEGASMACVGAHSVARDDLTLGFHARCLHPRGQISFLRRNKEKYREFDKSLG